MKKTIALLLGLVLILGFALVACGDEATTDDATDDAVEEVTDDAATDDADDDATTEDSAVEETSDAIDWTEAGDYEEQEVTITGTIDAVNDLWTEKQVAKVTLVMGEKEGDHFNVAISLNEDGSWPEYVAQYADMLDQLVGKTVEVTGTVVVNTWESCFEINLTDADGDRVPDAEPAGTLVVL